jgi:hypothetical protein
LRLANDLVEKLPVVTGGALDTRRAHDKHEETDAVREVTDELDDCVNPGNSPGIFFIFFVESGSVPDRRGLSEDIDVEAIALESAPSRTTGNIRCAFVGREHIDDTALACARRAEEDNVSLRHYECDRKCEVMTV